MIRLIADRLFSNTAKATGFILALDSAGLIIR